jgi:Ribonuclease BN-like family.
LRITIASTARSGAVIALLTWFYIGAFVVLLGAALDSELARLRDAGDPSATKSRG